MCKRISQFLPTAEAEGFLGRLGEEVAGRRVFAEIRVLRSKDRRVVVVR